MLRGSFFVLLFICRKRTVKDAENVRSKIEAQRDAPNTSLLGRYWPNHLFSTNWWKPNEIASANPNKIKESLKNCTGTGRGS